MGADVHDPQRYRDREEPTGSDRPLGAPPRWFSAARKAIWREMADEIPWLCRSDRTALALAVVLAERMQSGEATASELGQLRLCLSAFGATPASRSSVRIPEDEDEDALAEFVN